MLIITIGQNNNIDSDDVCGYEGSCRTVKSLIISTPRPVSRGVLQILTLQPTLSAQLASSVPYLIELETNLVVNQEKALVGAFSMIVNP